MATGRSSVNYLTVLEEAIHEMSWSDKEAYLKAKETAPQLILKESNPKWFLQYEKNNTWAAAKRLALYWIERVNTFGPQRAFLPLDTTGEGALSREAIDYHFTGYVARLPNDTQGRAVFLYDPDRKIRFEMRFRLEHTFYILALIVQNNETFGEKGIISIFLLRNQVFSIDESMSPVIQLGRIFPFFFHKIHLVPVESSSCVWDSLVPFMLAKLTPFVCNDNIVVHQHSSSSVLVRNLETHGLLKEGLPDLIGGTWTFELHHKNWLEQQTRVEWGLSLLTGLVCSSHKQYHAKRLSELTESEKAERRRRYNVLNSRRRRSRDKADLETLTWELEQLNETNQGLRNHNQRLEHLFEQCQSILASMESESR